MSIRIEHISKFFGDFQALNDVSFSFSKGEIVGFLGPNGAGKSTTMKIICGYLKPTKGNVWLNGEKMDDINQVAFKKKIGYLPENNPIYPDLYVREYLHFVASTHQLDKKEATTTIDSLIERIELGDQLKKKIGELSKGYRQRVGLVAALIGKPEVLVLDEPTSGLDPNQVITFRKVIQSLSEEKAILLSSHILPEIEALCQRLVIINKGNVIADDTLSHLKSKGKGMDEIFRSLTAV